MIVLLAPLVSAHPPSPSLGLAGDAWERVVDLALLGPMGCFQSHATISWQHRSGGWTTAGRAESVWRFDHRVWRLDEWTISEADPRSLEVRITPQLLGSSIEADLVYPMTKSRTFRWPPPVATLPTRLFGSVSSTSIDELPEGVRRVREAFDWDGWKKVEGEIAVTLAPGTIPVDIAVDATDRWPDGCRVQSIGAVSLGGRGLPTEERWTLVGRCPLRSWEGIWAIQFGSWQPCAFSGPTEM